MINKVLIFCKKSFGENLQVMFHQDDFVVYKNGNFHAQIFYSEIED